MVRLFSEGVALGYFILSFQGGAHPECSCVRSHRRAAGGGLENFTGEHALILHRGEGGGAVVRSYLRLSGQSLGKRGLVNVKKGDFCGCQGGSIVL